MKTPEYVATVTRIYRKYIDLALSGNKYVVDEADKLDLQQGLIEVDSLAGIYYQSQTES